MQLSLFINDVDYSDAASFSSLNISRKLGGEIATAQVSLVSTTEDPITIDNFDVLEIYNADTDDLVFAGNITIIDYKHDAPGVDWLTIDAQDYTALLDTVFVNQMYDGFTDKGIIQHAFAAKLPEIDTSNVSMLQTLPWYEAKDLSLRQLLENLSEITGGEWWITFDKKLFYRNSSFSVAPFNLSDEPDDSTSFGFQLSGYKKNFTKRANRVTVLAANDAFGFEISVTVNDEDNQAEVGRVYAATVIDRNIPNLAVATIRAYSELARRVNPEESGTIELYKDGLEVGQTIHIESEAHNIDDSYLIRAISIAQVDNDKTKYTIEFGDAQRSLVGILRALQGATQTTKAPPAGGGSITIPEGGITNDLLADGAVTPDKMSDLDTLSIETFQGNLPVSRVDNLDTLAIASFTGTLPIDRLENLGSFNINDFSGQIPIDRLENLGSFNIGNFSGSLSVERIDNLGSINLNSLSGAISISQISNLDQFEIGQFNGVLVSSQVADGLIDSVTKIDSGVFGYGIASDGSVLKTTVNGGNLLSNPGFEFDFKDWGGVSAGASIDTTNAYSGGKCGKVAGTNESIATININNVPVKPGEQFVLEVWVKSVIGATGQTACLLRFFDANDNHLSDGEAFGEPSSSRWGFSNVSTLWHTMRTGICTAPATATQMQVYAIWTGSATGTHYVDNVLLTRAVDESKISSINLSTTIFNGILAAGAANIAAENINGVLNINNVPNITADKIETINLGALPTQGSNLCPNPGFEKGSQGWTPSANVLTPMVFEPSTARTGLRCISHSATPNNGSPDVQYAAASTTELIPVSAGDRLSVEAWVYSESGADGLAVLYLHYYDNNKTLFTSNTAVYSSPVSAWTRIVSPNEALPTGTAYVQVVVRVDNHFTGGRWLIDDVALYRQIAGSQIQPLTINSTHINSINGDKIEIGSIPDSAIGSLNGAVINAGSIPNSAIGSVNGGKIIVGTIPNSAIGSIHGSKVEINSIPDSAIVGISGTKLVVNSVDSSKIDSLHGSKLIVNTVSHTAIASVKGEVINFNSIEDSSIRAVGAGKLTVGIINVTGGGMNFSGAGGIIVNGGNVQLLGGGVTANTGTFKVSGVGWDIIGGTVPLGGRISGPGYVNADGGFRVNGTSGKTLSVVTPGGTLWFSGGILVNVT